MRKICFTHNNKVNSSYIHARASHVGTYTYVVMFKNVNNEVSVCESR